MSEGQSRVLDVGNCDPDHAAIHRLLTENFDVAVDRVMFVDEALKQMRENRYDLVLYNRLVFDDGSEGIELVLRAKREEALESVPVMMISNYPEAQAASVAAGGVSGFGKNALSDSSTLDLLSACLPRK
ncbi:MAG: hypothetical protein O7B26_02430 [Planctomycetota bacterium]|nr:hypothetical protein [Planctomycetota bacterium]